MAGGDAYAVDSSRGSGRPSGGGRWMRCAAFLAFLLVVVLGITIACLVLILNLTNTVSDLESQVDALAQVSKVSVNPVSASATTGATTTTTTTTTTAAPAGDMADCGTPIAEQESIDLGNMPASSVFHSLNTSELQAVRDYLFSQMELVDPAEAHPNQSYIIFIELFLPPKAQVLDYLDNGGNEPERVAIASVSHGGMNPPRVTEYHVRPAANPTNMEEYRNPSYRRYPIPHLSKPITTAEYEYEWEPYMEMCSTLKDLLLGSFGETCCEDTVGHDKPCLNYLDTLPIYLAAEKWGHWYILSRNIPGEYVWALPFEFEFYAEGTDTSTWKVRKIYYANTLFNSVEEVAEAYRNGSVRVSVPKPSQEDRDRTRMHAKEPIFPKENKRGPQLIEPDGHRYKVTGNKIEYLAWSLHFGIRVRDGPQIYDVRFDNQRVVYEAGLREAAAVYGGESPFMQQDTNLDTGWLLGGERYRVLKGQDCPPTATYFSTTLFMDTHEPETVPDSMCVFETNLNVPLRHHHSSIEEAQSDDFVSVLNDYALVLRTILTAFNYDYIIDFMFRPDGTIEAKVSLSGYILGNPWTPTVENVYGNQVFPGIYGPYHHHLVHFRVDLDVAGTKNRFATYDIHTERKEHPAYPGEFNIRRRFTKNLKETEKEALYKCVFDKPMYLIQYSEASRNRYNVPRGYRLAPHDFSYETIPKGPEGDTTAASWAHHQLIITKRKEGEDSSSSIYNQNSIKDPVVDIDDFIQDDDSIVDEDLVMWISLGKHHIPHSEDIPVTLTSGAHVGFLLQPYNFFDDDPSMRMRDAVLAQPKDKGGIVTNGLEKGSCQYNTPEFLYTAWDKE